MCIQDRGKWSNHSIACSAPHGPLRLGGDSLVGAKGGGKVWGGQILAQGSGRMTPAPAPAPALFDLSIQLPMAGGEGRGSGSAAGPTGKVNHSVPQCPLSTGKS